MAPALLYLQLSMNCGRKRTIMSSEETMPFTIAKYLSAPLSEHLMEDDQNMQTPIRNAAETSCISHKSLALDSKAYMHLSYLDDRPSSDGGSGYQTLHWYCRKSNIQAAVAEYNWIIEG